ncbi:MAG: glycosyltransferase [Syntrophales bacterium]|nr:glycosyltransferase [Syntrophales bacterium]
MYRRMFHKLGLKVPGESEIKDIIHRRHPSIKPKKKGDLRILAIYHHYNWEDTSLKPALEKFGEVWRYDWFERLGLEGEWPRRMKETLNIDLTTFVSDLLKKIRPDVIFMYVTGEQVTPETMKFFEHLGIPTVNLSLNDKENFVGKIYNGQALGVRDICRYFTLNWTSTEDALVKYLVEGALPIYLPEGANPEVHKPLNLEKTIECSFVGQCYGNRRHVIEHLRARGIKVEAFGSGWLNGPLSTEAMVQLYSKSHINLGFSGVMGHRNTYCLKGRDFEIPMSGGLYLTEHHTELEKVYEIGREIVTYQGLEDLVSKIRELLQNPEKAEQIRQAGYRRARRDHTWEQRFDKIFKLLGVI